MFGRVAIVTGGYSGIGKEIALECLRNRMKVMVLDLVQDPRSISEFQSNLKQTILIEEENRKIEEKSDFFVSYCRADVSQEEQVQRAVSQTLEEFGRIDLLVNNAAITRPVNSPIESLSLDAWNHVLAVNLTGPFLMSKHCVESLRKSPKGGSIVNISSTRAVMSEKHGEAYSSTKAGLLVGASSPSAPIPPSARIPFFILKARFT